RRYESQPVGRVIALINLILRGGANYYSFGQSGRCFGYVRDWVERKVRRHLMRARKRRGFGWKRWSKSWLYNRLGLYGTYHLRRLKQLRLTALPA
ncbi:group II intron reverse transcriptase/maturase, partial [Candidatus Entotheonella serta]